MPGQDLCRLPEQLAQGSVHSGETAPWLAFPLAGQAGLGSVADSVLNPDTQGQTDVQGQLSDVEFFCDLSLARRSAVVVGCDL